MKKEIFFVGNYNLNTDSKGIYTIQLDSQTGKMKILNTCSECENPSYLVTKKDVLYVANEVSDKAYINAYRIKDDGSLKIIDTITVPGAGMCYLAVWKEDYISGANYTTGENFTCSLHPDGTFNEVVDIHYNQGSSSNPIRQEKAHAHSITPDHNTEYWVGADLGTDEIFYYQADSKVGKMKKLETITIPAGAGPRHFTFDNTNTYGYLVTELSSCIYVYKKEQNQLVLIQTIDACIQKATIENYAAHIIVSKDNQLVYVSNRGQDTIDIFKRQSDGTLKAYACCPSYGKYPRHFAIDSSGKYMVIAHQKSNEIVSCEILEDGKIGACVERISIPKAINICFYSAN